MDQGGELMPAILCAMPESTYRRMFTPELENALGELGEVTYCFNAREMSEEEYARFWEQAEAAITGWGVRAPTPEIIDRATRLRIISHTAGSLRMFPRYALEKGIVITTARAAIARTVAEFSLMNALMLLRRAAYYVDSSPERKRFYAPEGERPRLESLYNKPVGLIGFGVIGRIFRRLLEPFGCAVSVHDPYLSAEDAARANVRLSDLATLLRESKIVSLHAPEISETRHMIGAEQLDALQDGAVFLNAARGRLVDTEALTTALQTGRFYAAIDVTDPEPLPADHPLRSLPNVLFTPHIAGPTDDEIPRLTEMALEDLRRFLSGQRPLYAISLEGYDLMSF